MKKRYLLASGALIFSMNVSAGLFDSTPEFKCGREDSISATQAKIRNDAISKLQETYLSTPAEFYGKPLQSYIDKANKIAIVMENVTTSPYEKDNSVRNCSAKVSLTLPPELQSVMTNFPDKLASISPGKGKVLNDRVQWENYRYSLSLADNGKDISVSYEYTSTDYVAESLFNITLFALNKDDLEKANLQRKLSSAAYSYADSDRNLNMLWKSLPDSVRASMKKEQSVWIGDKARKCGKISDAASEAVSLQTRIDIYQCQTKMTEERVTYLGGDTERDY
ncbi:lysozyme inhibitor LprI family protein [uncultured Enterobacter sp.]|uniref:lysozyme inhibitor LprI family protein n=1 Tax=uncultured Enterobacter sp. TaxID=238202 RepID=UPI00262C8D77|nr:lysozyme inhibitor LprI family protein [uncultured Enterobacter sp.]